MHGKSDQNRLQNNNKGNTSHSQNRTSHSSGSNMSLNSTDNVQNNLQSSEEDLRQVARTQSLVTSVIPNSHSGVSTKGTKILLATARVKIMSKQGLPVEDSCFLIKAVRCHLLLKI